MVMLQRGIRKTNPLPIVTLVAATSLNLFTLSTGRSAVIKKLHLYNGAALPVNVSIGTGITPVFAAAMPDIYMLAGMDLQIGENEMPYVEFYANITFESTIAGVVATIEVEEIG